jgi:hypothetical protein
MAERIRQHQYIGGVIVYILNRQGGTNFVDFLEGSHHVAYSKSKFNALSELKTAFYPRFAYLSRQCLLIKL